MRRVSHFSGWPVIQIHSWLSLCGLQLKHLEYYFPVKKTLAHHNMFAALPRLYFVERGSRERQMTSRIIETQAYIAPATKYPNTRTPTRIKHEPGTQKEFSDLYIFKYSNLTRVVPALWLISIAIVTFVCVHVGNTKYGTTTNYESIQN